MLIKTGHVQETLKHLEKLETVLSVYSNNALKVKEAHNKSLLEVLRSDVLNAGFPVNQDFFTKVNNLVDQMFDFSTNKFRLYKKSDYVKMIITAKRDTSLITEFNHWFNTNSFIFEFQETKATIESNINRIQNYLNSLTLEDSSITRSGQLFLRTYRDKVSLELYLDKKNLDTLTFEDSLYSDYVIRYINNNVFETQERNKGIFLQSENPSSEIFSQSMYGSPQEFLEKRSNFYDLKNNFNYLIEVFKTKELYVESNLESFVKKAKSDFDNELSHEIINIWSSSKPTGYDDFNYEYNSPFKNNMSNINSLLLKAKNEDQDKNLWLSLNKFDYLGSWVRLWCHSKNINNKEFENEALKQLVFLIDKAPNKALNFENYAVYINFVKDNII